MNPRYLPRPIPNAQLVELVAAALGEQDKTTRKRGPKVQEFIFELFELNAHENRARSSVICARAELLWEVYDTLCTNETGRRIESDPHLARRLLAALDKSRKAEDFIRSSCNTALERETSQD